MAKAIKIRFNHPRDSRTLETDCDPGDITGAGAITFLTDEGFLAKLTDRMSAYQLSIDRTGKAVLPNATFADAGVKDGDSLTVTETGAGA